MSRMRFYWLCLCSLGPVYWWLTAGIFACNGYLAATDDSRLPAGLAFLCLSLLLIPVRMYMDRGQLIGYRQRLQQRQAAWQRRLHAQQQFTATQTTPLNEVLAPRSSGR